MSNEPRECGKCRGSGKCRHMQPAATNDKSECSSCNGTGRVWPSVEGEIVTTGTVDYRGFFRPDVSLLDMFQGMFDQAHKSGSDVVSFRVNVIVQPLPAAQKGGGSTDYNTRTSAEI